MNKNIWLWTFILLLPALAVLGHDLYIAYGNTDKKIENLKNLDVELDAFSLSDIGWIWLRYSPKTLETFKDSITKENWDDWVVPTLEQTTLLVSLIPFVTLYFILGLIGIYNFLFKSKRGGHMTDSRLHGKTYKPKTPKSPYKRR